MPGARVLDLGCGDGATLRELTGRVGAGGWLLGIDRNPRALAAAAAAMPPGPPRWLLIRGDLAKPLPIATGSVDRFLCHNTLEALADPAGLLVEAHRVLRPGGQAVIGHSDFDTLVFAGADLALTRRLVHNYCDRQQPGWMDAVDGTIGRRLPALVRRSPLQVRQVHAEVLLEQGLCPPEPSGSRSPRGGRHGRQVTTQRLVISPSRSNGASRVRPTVERRGYRGR
jgi:SAM-dependent methyltransferase